MAAIGMERLRAAHPRGLRRPVWAAIVVPGVVIGIATLVALVEVFRLSQPVARLDLAGRTAAANWRSATARSSPRTACFPWRW
jgi:ABC-type spermidine/putrescine transport system permease subunit II